MPFRSPLVATLLLLGAGAIAGAAVAAPERGAGPDPGADVAHCGAGGHACPAPPHAKPACIAGRCEFTCDAGYTLCGDRCVSLQSDVLHCGACGRACPGEDPPASSSYCDQSPRRACVEGQCRKCRWYCGGYGGYYRACT